MIISDTWPLAKINNLRSLWGLGWSAARIAKSIGKTRNAVIGKAKRIGLSRRPSPIIREGEYKTYSPSRVSAWHPEDDEMLRDLAKRGHSEREIAYEMDIDHVRVHRRAKKLGITLKKEKRTRSSYLSRETRASELQLKRPEYYGDPTVFAGVGISLFLAGARNCRWPLDGLGADGMPRCCGNEMHSDGPYCVDHARRAYNGETKAQAEAA